MKQQLYLGLVAIVIVTSGCQWYTSTSTQGTSIEFEGSFNVSEGDFTIEGQIVNYAREGEQHSFEDLRVYLYSENETVLNSTRFDRLETRSPRFSLSASKLPEHIIIYSDGFWQIDEFKVEYYSHTEMESSIPYDPDFATSKDELPVIPDAEINTTTGSP
ncbi:hypothetical protein [Halapricum salinum]|uniref:Lipoprotein n=1 Tax=Halapricum salinum TaxID=1457250 RepID=A0A4D6HFH6_9EURY|nr:hypothetical protein [Halapricum salinum]QCC52026.1 hypothetical protein DV733_12660 [Halapricum salinum]